MITVIGPSTTSSQPSGSISTSYSLSRFTDSSVFFCITLISYIYCIVFTDTIITISQIILLFDFVVAAVQFFFHSLFFVDTMSDIRIHYTTYRSMYKDGNADPMGMNNDAAKMEKIAKYAYLPMENRG